MGTAPITYVITNVPGRKRQALVRYTKAIGNAVILAYFTSDANAATFSADMEAAGLYASDKEGGG